MNSKSSRTGPAFESLEAAMIARPIGNHSNAQKQYGPKGVRHEREKEMSTDKLGFDRAC